LAAQRFAGNKRDSDPGGLESEARRDLGQQCCSC
jgi:hypothetical protein